MLENVNEGLCSGFSLVFSFCRAQAHWASCSSTVCYASAMYIAVLYCTLQYMLASTTTLCTPAVAFSSDSFHPIPSHPIHSIPFHSIPFDSIIERLARFTRSCSLIETRALVSYLIWETECSHIKHTGTMRVIKDYDSFSRVVQWCRTWRASVTTSCSRGTRAPPLCSWACGSRAHATGPRGCARSRSAASCSSTSRTTACTTQSTSFSASSSLASCSPCTTCSRGSPASPLCSPSVLHSSESRRPQVLLLERRHLLLRLEMRLEVASCRHALCSTDSRCHSCVGSMARTWTIPSRLLVHASNFDSISIRLLLRCSSLAFLLRNDNLIQYCTNILNRERQIN